MDKPIIIVGIPILTGLLIMMPSQISPRSGRIEHFPDGISIEGRTNWGFAMLNPARQIAYAINVPILPLRAWAVRVSPEYFEAEPAVLDIVFIIGVGAFWFWLVPMLYRGPKDAGQGRFAHLAVLLALLGDVAYCGISAPAAHYWIIRIGAVTWFCAVVMSAFRQASLLLRKWKQTPTKADAPS